MILPTDNRRRLLLSKAGDWSKGRIKYLFHILLPCDGKRFALFARLVAL